MDWTSLAPLVGVPVIVLGFALRMNALLVVIASALVTGWAVGMPPWALLELLGEKFLGARSLAVVVLILPVVALLEQHGLREHAQAWVARLRGATTGRILMLYFVVRQCASALGLTSLGGPAQTVRPLLAPMAEGLAAQRLGPLPRPLRDRIAAHAAACDNVALFFGEDIFIAFGAVLLIHSFMLEGGLPAAEPLQIGLWALPTALLAAAIHLFRLWRLDVALTRLARAQGPVAAAAAQPGQEGAPE